VGLSVVEEEGATSLIFRFLEEVVLLLEEGGEEEVVEDLLGEG
jgi:hypothetical protein